MKTRRVATAAVFVLTAAAGVTGAASPAAAVPNDCSAPSFYRDYQLAPTGTLYHTCSAGTQVNYVIDCFLNDTSISHYFATDEQWSAHIDCDNGGPAIGIWSYDFV